MNPVTRVLGGAVGLLQIMLVLAMIFRPEWCYHIVAVLVGVVAHLLWIARDEDL